MRVFVTGATGFIGSAVIPELLAAGHTVLGLARSDEGATALEQMGVESHRGELTDLDSLAAGARACDGVIHLAFIHDFSQFMANMAIDRKAVETLIGALEGTGKPLISTSGTAMFTPGRAVVETDWAEAVDATRAGTELVVKAAADRGVRAVVLRLPQVHDTTKAGLISYLIENARQKGMAAYIGDGANRWPAAHVSDVGRLYRLALEKATPGVALHAVGESGVSNKAIAEVIGAGMGVPVRSLAMDEAGDYLGWMAMFAGLDNLVSSAITRETMGWTPTGPGLLADLRAHFDG